MELELQGKTVVVTGTGAGIGRATAAAFLKEGAHVVGIDLKHNSDDEIAQRIECHDASVTDADAMRKILQDTKAKHGHIAALINNAGIQRNTLANTLSSADIEQVLGINVQSLLEMSYEYYRLQRKDGGGIIVNLASVIALIGAPMGTLYGASKGAGMAATRSMAVEWARHQFRVNAVCPGLTETAMTEKVQNNKMMRESNLRDIPMQRFAAPEEIADAILFLCSARASFITGQGIVVDGGFTAK